MSRASAKTGQWLLDSVRKKREEATKPLYPKAETIVQQGYGQIQPLLSGRPYIDKGEIMEVAIYDGKRVLLLRGGETCFELCEQRKVKEQETWTPFLYFVNLEAAFNELLRRKVRNSDARSLQELKEVIREAQAELVEVWSLGKPPQEIRSGIPDESAAA